MSPHGVHAREQTAFRLPPDLRVRLKAQAKREGRAMTALVIDAINAYLTPERQGPPPPKGNDNGTDNQASEDRPRRR